jgi:hypothetical protein
MVVYGMHELQQRTYDLIMFLDRPEDIQKCSEDTADNIGVRPCPARLAGYGGV